jgi:hypothetical protein
MGLTWAAGWAVAGILIGVMSMLMPSLPWDSFFEVFDAPLPALAVPGFFGGVLFSIVLGIAGRHRRFDELSVARFAALGALGGVLLSLVPDAMVAMGLATIAPESGLGPWRLTAMIIVPLTLMSAASAAASLMLARNAQVRQSLEGSGNVGDAGLTEGSGQELLPQRTRSHVR